jgi:hypothetical protein
MGEFFHDPFASVSGLDRWTGDFSSSRFRPWIYVVDDGEALRITAELSGMDREALQTSIEDGALVLGGEKKQDMRSEQDGRDRLERSYGAFMRTGTHWGGGRAHHIWAVDPLFRPGAFALYKASSAALITVVRSSSIWGPRLTAPILAVTHPYSLPAFSFWHAQIADRIFSAISEAPAADVSGRTTINSSPPYRAALSTGRRTLSAMHRATAVRVSCP